MKTKARGIWANFAVDCPRCDGELTVSQGRIDPHDCRTDLDSIVFPEPS